MSKPFLPNLEPIIAAGINPKTGLPIKVSSGSKCLKEDIKRQLRVIDEQRAVNRFEWTLPDNLKLTSQELERMIYYKGQVALFYLKELDEYAVLPYALDGTIDLYGRFNTIHPVPFAGGTEDKNQKSPIAYYLATLKLKCIYKPGEEEDPAKSAVLLHDYSKQLSQTVISRQVLNDPLIDVMAECVPLMRTRLILGTGVKGIRVQDADQQQSVSDGSRRLEQAAMQGEAYVPIIGNLEFQDLAAESAGKSEEYMLAMQSIDNLLLSTYGITNGGLFEKKAHELQSEQDVNNTSTSAAMTDALEIRKHFCEVANKVFGINISVAVKEAPEEPKMSEEGEIDDDTNDTAVLDSSI